MNLKADLHPSKKNGVVAIEHTVQFYEDQFIKGYED